MNKFLWLVEAYPGYCQVCNEPKPGQPGRGVRAAVSQDGLQRLLRQLADEKQRRTAAFMAQTPGQRFPGAATAAGDGSGPPPRTGGNPDEGAPHRDGQAVCG